VSAITGRLLGWLSGDGVIDASEPIFPATAASRGSGFARIREFRGPIGIAGTELTDDSDRLGANFLRHENRCLERLMLAKAMSAMNRMLRTSGGTSIIVGRLDCAKAENEECNRRNGATGAVNSENVQDLSLRTSQLRAVNFDDRIILQPKIAGRLGYKSSSMCADPDFRSGLVKTSLWGGNHIEFILNRM
jgi:hypothetical protein